MSLSETRKRLGYRLEWFRLRLRGNQGYYILLLNLACIVLLGSLVLMLFEKRANPEIHNYGDALWLTFVSMATIGYGDIVPITAGGRITVAVTLILAVGFLSAFIAMMAGSRAEKARRRGQGLERQVKTKGHYIVCGWNERGKVVLSRLNEETGDSKIPIILMCDTDESPVDYDYVFFIKGSAVNREDLLRVNLEEASGVILLADELPGGDPGDIDARTVLAALTIKAINPDAQVTAEALRPENVAHLRLAGVREILDINEIAGNLLARSALHFGLITTMDAFATRGKTEQVYRVPVDKEMEGKDYDSLTSVLAEDGYTLLGVVIGGVLRTGMKADQASEGDLLILLGETRPPSAV